MSSAMGASPKKLRKCRTGLSSGRKISAVASAPISTIGMSTSPRHVANDGSSRSGKSSSAISPRGRDGFIFLTKLRRGQVKAMSAAAGMAITSP